MAAHNSARTIAQAIQSVRLQTYVDWELIVVDDGSQDETADIASSFQDERIRVISQQNRGPAAARNRGIAEAHTPLISMLDSDDLWLPTYLEEMTRALASDRDAVFAYTDAWVLDDKSKRIRKTTEMGHQNAPDPAPATAQSFYEELLERNFVYNSVTIRRANLNAVGGYEERLPTCEDWELWLRLTANGCRGIRVPGVLAIHRNHPGSLSTHRKLMNTSRNQVFEIIKNDWRSDGETRTLAVRIHQERWRRRPQDFEATHKPTALRTLWRVVHQRTLLRRRPPKEVEALLKAVESAHR